MQPRIKKLFPLAFLCGLLFLGFRYYKASKSFDVWANWETYSRVEEWRKSSDCAIKTGVVLAMCVDDKIYPVENYILGDDKGHNLIINIMALIQRAVPSRKALIRLNVFINIVGVLSLAGALYLYGWNVLGLFALLAGAAIAVPGGYTGTDVFSSAIGIFLLTLSSILLFANGLARLHRSETKTWPFFVSSLLLQAAAINFREAIGLIGFGICFLLSGFQIGYWLWRKRDERPRLLFSLLCLGSLILPALSPKFILTARNVMFKLTPSDYVATHGFSHVLLMGLGEETNKFGIRWDDAYGGELIARKAPSVVFTSNEYYRLAREEYLQHVFHDPFEVARIYFRKLDKSIQVLGIPRFVFIGFFIVWLVCLGWFIYSLFRDGADFLLDSSSQALQGALAMGLAAVLMLMQGILGWPFAIYMYPAKFGFLVFVGLAIQGAWLTILRNRSSEKNR